MANIYTHQSLTIEQQNQITYSDLDCMVNWLHTFALEDDSLVDFGFIFRNGMPQQFPNGKWGFTLTGDMGVMIRPEPKPLDLRVDQRMGTPNEWRVEYGSFIEIISKYTEYRHKNRLQLKHPYRIAAEHLEALRNTIPTYLQYLVYKMFVGTEAAKMDCYLKDWIEAYIEPADGATNGYKFYLSGGHGSVNYSDHKDKVKITEHKLKKRLEDINKALRNDSRKIEVDVEQMAKLKTKWPTENLTPESKKTAALWMEAKKLVRDIRVHGRFNKKYKHKNENNWEGFVPKITETDGLILLVNKHAMQDLKMDFEMSTQGTGAKQFFDIEAKVIESVWIDKDEAILLQNGLLQSWIPDEFIQYKVVPHENPGENTIDYYYEIAHTLDLVDIFCSAYLKLKK